jgi:hypothetical protein
MLKSLQKFGDVLMEHTINDAKTPLTTVVSHFDDWNMARQSKEADLQTSTEEYMINHENPRKDAIMTYKQYVSQQTEAYLRYENAATQDKNQALQDYVKVRPPAQMLQTGVHTDFVYTKVRAKLKP